VYSAGYFKTGFNTQYLKSVFSHPFDLTSAVQKRSRSFPLKQLFGSLLFVAVKLLSLVVSLSRSDGKAAEL
jgi:hypothetical protein